MAKAAVDGVRSVALGVPDLDASGKFYADNWHLDRVAAAGDAVYFRGTSAYHHILALHRRPRPELLSLDLTAADRTSVDALYARARASGVAEIASRPRSPSRAAAMASRSAIPKAARSASSPAMRAMTAPRL